jgi:hypothetical protein
VRHVSHIREMRNAYKILYGKPEGKRPPVRPKRRWEYNIKMDLKYIGWEDRDRGRALVNTVMNPLVP